MRHGYFVIFSALASVALSTQLHAQTADPAHVIAQKFAEPAASPARAAAATATPKPTKSEPAKDTRAKAQSPALTAADLKSGPVKITVAPPPSADYEQEMLHAARAEADARALANKATHAAAPTAAPKIPAAVPSAVSSAAAAPRLKIETTIRVPDVTDRFAEAVSPDTKSSQPHNSAQTAAAQPEPSPAAQRATTQVANERATILVVLSHSASQPGSLPKSFDPILCVDTDCYVSAGPGLEAKRIAKSEALSTKNAITGGAGACAGKNQCAFRGISISAQTQFEIIDIGLVRHDRHEPLHAVIDGSCHIDGGDLFCENPLTAPDYRIWIMSEDIASNAGAEGLDDALSNELPEPDVTRETDK